METSTINLPVNSLWISLVGCLSGIRTNGATRGMQSPCSARCLLVLVYFVPIALCALCHPTYAFHQGVFKEVLHSYLMLAVFCSVEEGCGGVEAKEECAVESSEWRHCDKKDMHKLSWQGNVPESAVLMKIASLMPSGAGMQDNTQFTHQPSYSSSSQPCG